MCVCLRFTVTLTMNPLATPTRPGNNGILSTYVHTHIRIQTESKHNTHEEVEEEVEEEEHEHF